MKLFVVSDIHSFYTPFKKALDKAGFDSNNNEHWLIVCGDSFDRGNESEELLNYLMSIERKILIKGNHDLLLEECCSRGFPYKLDKHNGTFNTIVNLGDSHDFSSCCKDTLDRTAAYRNQLVNYFETENYIFVHSWIPMDVKYDETDSKPWYLHGKINSYKEDWRNANEAEWEEAMWGNPFHRAKEGLNKTGKTIVFGHWHCSAGYVLNDDVGIFREFDEYACWEPYKNKQQGIIGIDRCTVHTGEVNILVLEDNFINNK